MNIVSTQYSLKDYCLEIYVSGCKGHCGTQDICQNGELWSFDLGEPYKNWYEKISHKLQQKTMVKKCWILGGEPLDQNIDELIDLLKFIKSFNIELWLWTSFSLEEIPAKIKELCDFIKTGKFIPNQKYYLSEYNIELASPNQKINKKGIDY